MNKPDPKMLIVPTNTYYTALSILDVDDPTGEIAAGALAEAEQARLEKEQAWRELSLWNKIQSTHYQWKRTHRD